MNFNIQLFNLQINTHLIYFNRSVMQVQHSDY